MLNIVKRGMIRLLWGIGISPEMLDVLQTSPTIRDIVKDKKVHNDK